MKDFKFSVQKETTLLDYLLTCMSGKSRNHVKAVLTRGQVSVDGKRITRHDAPLKAGQTVMINSKAPARFEELPFPIMFEDKDLLVIEKPAGLLSMANEREKLRTAYRMATDYLRAKDPKSRIFIVHRLDRDTSGVLVFAKTEKMKRDLQDNWDKIVEKRGYVAVVEGCPSELEGTVKSHLCETSTHLVFSAEEGRNTKEAITHYKVLQRGHGYSLVEVNIDTGRKNQIRVHMQDLGCPVAGDRQYGARSDPFGRLALHAGELIFTRPDKKKKMKFVAELPKEFNKVFR